MTRRPARRNREYGDSRFLSGLGAVICERSTSQSGLYVREDSEHCESTTPHRWAERLLVSMPRTVSPVTQSAARTAGFERFPHVFPSPIHVADLAPLVGFQEQHLRPGFAGVDAGRQRHGVGTPQLTCPFHSGSVESDDDADPAARAGAVSPPAGLRKACRARQCVPGFCQGGLLPTAQAATAAQARPTRTRTRSAFSLSRGTFSLSRGTFSLSRSTFSLSRSTFSLSRSTFPYREALFPYREALFPYREAL